MITFSQTQIKNMHPKIEKLFGELSKEVPRENFELLRTSMAYLDRYGNKGFFDRCVERAFSSR